MYRTALLWVIIVLGLVMVFNFMNPSETPKRELSYSAFIELVESGEVQSVVIKEKMISGEIKEKKIYGELTSGEQIEVFAPEDSGMVEMLTRHNVEINVKPPAGTPWYISALISWFPIFLLIGLWIFFMRQMQGGGGNKAFSFGKSRAKLLVPDEQKVTFKEVAGVEEAKEELVEIVDFLKDPGKFQKLGGKIPKGVLLVGSPGTGKTLLAKAVAGEAGVPFFSISGSDFVEMFVGVGAARIRDLFEQGKKNAPCIIFIDEIDAVGRHRGAGLGGGHDEREQTLNALLVEMDGFESTEGVIIIAATNRPDVLDPALLRPGRFDRRVVVSLPDYKGRYEILKVHAGKVPLSDNVDLEVLARSASGFSGAELANLVNEAALAAARANKDKVDNASFEYAKDKIMMGKERRSMVMSEKTKKIVAYHESGHAIIAMMIPGADPVHKVTIIPREVGALGFTAMLEQDENMYLVTKEYMMGRITVAMGGRAAESLVFHHYTTGAGGDIKSATSIAKNMVTVYGMSDALGPLAFEKSESSVFLGKEISSSKSYSEKTAVQIDEEVRKIVDYCYDQAIDILQNNMLLLNKMSEMLLDKETIDATEVENLIVEYADEKWKKMALENIEGRKATLVIADRTD